MACTFLAPAAKACDSDNVVIVNNHGLVVIFRQSLGEDVLNWSMGARLFIGATRNSALSRRPGMEADLCACVRLIRDVALLLEPE